MPLPSPQPGLVVGYAYLWRHERDRGRDEGVKSRPCTVVLASTSADGALVVTVAPITHRRPAAANTSVALTSKVKRNLGLHAAPSWIIADEVNRFIWPGPDLRPVSFWEPDRFDYGFLPEDVFDELRRKIVGLYRSHRLDVVRRSS